MGMIRTGAATSVATKHMSRPDSSRVGIYGAGWQARG
jgi:ornithine cyclodeaminase/alanine dehydrogenase-like protein (mu-crystallin family)